MSKISILQYFILVLQKKILKEIMYFLCFIYLVDLVKVILYGFRMGLSLVEDKDIFIVKSLFYKYVVV